jgi:uncharacterized protein YgfB (UPF0149 family)
MASLPDFEHTLALAQGNYDAPELSECHGVACGLLCRKPDSTFDAYMSLSRTLEIVDAPAAGFSEVLEDLFASSREQLADENMGLTLWLPEDNEILEERTMALSQWCNGFLAGLGSGGKEALSAMSEDANDALNDLLEISKAEVLDTEESEEDENAYVEIVEYVRIVVYMIREDLRGPDELDQIH